MVCIGYNKTNIIHHLTSRKTNILMKFTSNYKAAVFLASKRSPTKIKDLTNKDLSKGKATKTNLIFLISYANIKNIYSLAYTTVSYQSYTFCPTEFLEVIHKAKKESITTLQLLHNIITKLKQTNLDQNNFEIVINSFQLIFA